MAETSPCLNTMLRFLTGGPIMLWHRASIAAQLWKPLHERIMLGECPCLPFCPHFLREKDDQHVVHHDEWEGCAGRDAEDHDRRDQSEGERDFVGLIQFGSHRPEDEPKYPQRDNDVENHDYGWEEASTRCEASCKQPYWKECCSE